jgi:hypothetical protein
MVNNSLAIEIVEFRSYNDTHEEYDWGYPYFTFYVQTDEPYDRLNWAVYDVETEETHWVGSTEGDGVSTYHYFSISDLSGEPKGKKYVIGVIAYQKKRIGGRDWMSFTIDTYNFRVFKVTTAWNNGTGQNTGAWGYVIIKKIYYDGRYIVMDSNAYARNPTDNSLIVAPWFRTNEYAGLNGDHIPPEHRDTKPLQTIEPGETSEYASPGPDRQERNDVGELEYAGDFNRDIGALTEDSVSRYFLAHAHLQVYTTEAQVRIDNWEADTGVQEFTHKDGP